MKKIVSTGTFIFDVEKHTEKVKKDSLTVQGEALSIKEIMYRSARGILPDNIKPVVFNDVVDFESIDMQSYINADIADKEEIVKQHKEILRRKVEYYNNAVRKKTLEEGIEEVQNSSAVIEESSSE